MATYDAEFTRVTEAPSWVRLVIVCLIAFVISFVSAFFNLMLQSTWLMALCTAGFSAAYVLAGQPLLLTVGATATTVVLVFAGIAGIASLVYAGLNSWLFTRSTIRGEL
jgi:hypothetical protein